MNPEQTSAKPDSCPAWASEMIHKIMLLEVETGTIKNPVDASKEEKWTTAELDELTKMASRMDANSYEDTSAEIEGLFSRIAKGLTSEGFDPETIAAMVNCRIPTGCRLPYCNAEEVRDAL